MNTVLQTDPNPIYTMLLREFGVVLDQDAPTESEAAPQEAPPAPR